MSTSSATDEPRFAMLVPVREYAQERLAASAEEPVIRLAHAQHVLALAQAAEPHLNSSAPWLQRLSIEHDNVRAALHWCQHTPDQNELALALAGSLMWFWYFHGNVREGYDALEAALAMSSNGAAEPDQHSVAKAMYGAGDLGHLLGETTTALVRLNESVRFLRACGDTQLLAYALAISGMTLMVAGDTRQADICLTESVSLFCMLGDTWGRAFALCFHGFLPQMVGDLPLAQHRFEEAAMLTRSLGDTLILTFPLNGLGEIAFAQGDLPRAAQLFAETLTYAQQHRNLEHIATALSSLGQVALAVGCVEHGARLCQEGLRLRWTLGDVIRIIWSLQILATAAHALGQWERAARMWGAVEQLRTRSTTPLPPGEQATFSHLIADVCAHLTDVVFTAAHATGADDAGRGSRVCA